MLKPGPNQVRSTDMAINKPSQKVSQGVYFSPHFQVCLRNYTTPIVVNKETYRLILQCRVNPEKILITRRQEYWVVNEPKDIRPYGVVLVKNENISQIKNPEQLFGEWFKYQNEKDEIESSR